ncbi:hypothetical protein [Paenibacillus odorifer]|uniref:hypothetical protein n=1 Tax=Paenibacillus odorifer TaxID=189426 RepID=UPI00096DAF1A|nr:hypothetical protein [Paenibacillus odorifer]OMD16258.1 hypothetical protein BJP50_18650 [Paenibacillus odorifer]
MSVTNIQQARAIISAVGEKHQDKVSDKLRSLTYNPSESQYDRDAQKVIDYMEHEYVLGVANVLWIEKYDQIPEHIRNYS